MSPENTEAAEEARRLVRAAFRGYVDQVGVDKVEDAIRQGEHDIADGGNGYSLVTGNHSSMLFVEEDGVNFSIGDFGGYKIPTDTAKAVLWEARSEQSPTDS